VDEYFRSIAASVDRAYAVAERARAVGIDPERVVEIPRAEDMAMRVEKLLRQLPIEGVAKEIRVLAETMPREEVAFTMALRLVNATERSPELELRLEMALRVGLAILTEGILVAPLEGLAEIHIRGPPNEGGYLELYYAGPIRAAGGTAQALSVLLADVVRREVGLGVYTPDPGEIGRYREEIPLYKYHQHLQYVPTADEIDRVVRNVPVCISGESTEQDAEVSAFRDLPRVPTNGIRGGACLVIAEGLCQKAPKLRKVVDRLGLTGWEFLEALGTSKVDADEDADRPKYLREAVGGRPILGYPKRAGGFRLRYGRARTTGIASYAVNPATMVVLRNFVAIGTQLKVEFPGKATAVAVCDTIEGPTVALEDGTVISVHDVETAQRLLPDVRRILDNGEMLVPFGEFLENNHRLEPGAYSLEWHLEELRAASVPIDDRAFRPTYEEATALSRSHGVPLHPRFLLFWHDLAAPELLGLARDVAEHGRWSEDALQIPNDPGWKDLLERLGWVHAVREGYLWGEPVTSAGLAGGLGLQPRGNRLERDGAWPEIEATTSALDLVGQLARVPVRARAPTRVGARVGRPEKAKERWMDPKVHALFPVGNAGGARRSIHEAATSVAGKSLAVELGVRECLGCGKRTVWVSCSSCGGATKFTGETSMERIPIAPLWTDAVHRLALAKVPEVKGVKGLTSSAKTPERLEKGLLRAFHGIPVYQDGTSRFDLTDMPLTHFRPAEIGLSLSKAWELGYVQDAFGAPLTEPDQLLELRPQDVIVARACGQHLLHLAQFLDDELVRVYDMPPFYAASRPDDLVGAMLVALAPHTSGGVAGRLIGFTEAEACFAHPLFHTAKRRNCDGDEDSVTLLIDALLNFSRTFLPQTRGSLMDKPLVLATRLDASEVDKEVQNLDIEGVYPLALFRAAAAHASAKGFDATVATVGSRIPSGRALDGYQFTHDTASIAAGPTISAYREAGSMARIVEQSLTVTTQLRAVDVADAITLVLNAHFLPDLMGNLKSFATQKFRCKVCGMSHRRPPLSGRCTAIVAGGRPCHGELLPTVYEGAVRKYLGLSRRLAGSPGVTPYLRQRLSILESSLATLFPGTPAQTVLESFGATPPPPRAEPPNTADPVSSAGGLVG
jgi:DNA polymerase II large subunit